MPLTINLHHRWVVSYMARHRKNASHNITEEVLEDMEAKTVEYHEVFKETIAKAMPVQGHTIKYHRLSHVTQVIRRLGNLKEYDAQFYEAANRREKELYKRTPGRQINEQHLEGMVVRLRTQEMAKAHRTFDPDVYVKHKNSAYTTAAESGEHTMVAVKIPLHTNGTTPNITLAASNWLERIPDWTQLRFQLAAFYNIADPDDLRMPCINVGSTAVLAAQLPWLEEGTCELQTVRASPTFHGKPYYDGVEIMLRDGISVASSSNTRNVGYAQLRLIFTAVNPVTNVEESLVFLRMYSKPIPDSNDVLYQHGCIPLSWARASNHTKGTGAYRVRRLDCIVRRMYIVPDFSKPGKFHTCAFKWSRNPAENYRE